MNHKFDTIIVITASDYLRVRSNYKRLIDTMPSERIIFVGSNEVGKLVKEEAWTDRISFVNENDILPFDAVHDVMKSLLKREDVPRRVTGWYYQQFLKMKYADFSENQYYMTWDGDTVPTKPFSMFDISGEHPYFDLKYEYHEEYFITLSRLFPGMGKVIGKSFISEHMLFNCEIMKRLIAEIENNKELEGVSFYEKILRAIRPSELLSNSFSEFETYGTYVALRCPTVYRLKEWHSIRYGSIYFLPDKMTDSDYEWLSRDFDAVSYEKLQDYNPGFNELFTNPEYRAKLTPRQIVEAIQEFSSEGMEEKWEQ